MSEQVARRVTIQLRFVALFPTDEDEADTVADRIGDDIVAALEANTPVGIFDQSFSIQDWDDEPESE